MTRKDAQALGLTIKRTPHEGSPLQHSRDERDQRSRGVMSGAQWLAKYAPRSYVLPLPMPTRRPAA